MNTQVKVGIAAAIVAALVALIVLDQKTTPKDDAGNRAPAGDPATIVGTNTGAEPSATRIPETEIKDLLDSAKKQFGETSPKAAGGTPIKGSEEPKEKRVGSASTSEEYAIKEGDRLDQIAQKHKTTVDKILEANPGLKPTALRVGKKIVIPGKEKPAPVLEKKEEPAVAQDTTPAPPEKAADPVKEKPAVARQEPALKVENGTKVYTVQAGDTLSGISVKVYNTSRHYQKIYEANKETIDDPNTLPVGLKLTMPDLPSKPVNGGAPGTGTVATTQTPKAPAAAASAPAGAKVVEVAQGDRLWNIAAKFAAERKIGIMDMIKLIVDANAEKKIREDGSNLQAGWQLIIPE